MVETDPMGRRNVQRQLAIFDVARRARGKSMPEIRQMLREAFASRRLPAPPGSWLDAAAAEAYYGEPYIVDLPAAVAADTAEDAPDPQVQQTLAKRRRLRRAEGLPAGNDSGAGAARAGGGRGAPGPASTRARRLGAGAVPAAARSLAAGAVVLAVAAAVVLAVHARRAGGPQA